jgi:hypothetical protein
MHPAAPGIDPLFSFKQAAPAAMPMLAPVRFRRVS